MLGLGRRRRPGHHDAERLPNADGYTLAVYVEARPSTNAYADYAGTLEFRAVAPYHLDPPDLVGTPPPAALADGASCLDQPTAPVGPTPRADGPNVAVDPFGEH